MKLPGRVLRVLIELGTSTRYRVNGDSMRPALDSKESVLATRLRKQGRPLQRGDVVVFRHPVRVERTYIKRVVGLPNEEIRIEGGLLYVDGILLEETYLNGPPLKRPEHDREWWNGPDEYFVLGDNRRDSHDSRAFGPIGRNLILGRVWFRCWPLRTFGPLSSDNNN